MGLQSVFGVVLQSFLTGIIFARFTLPAKRAQAVVFSKNALISVRNGVLNLLVQVRFVSLPKLFKFLYNLLLQITDLRKTPLIDCRARMVLVMKSETKEGEVIPFDRTELECSSELENANDRVRTAKKNTNLDI